MKRLHIAVIGLGILGFGAAASGATAQGDGCQTTTRSCSQMYQACSTSCNNANNPSRCIAQT